MKPRQQLDLMNKIIRELEDLKNSQTSVLKKIAQIEADNINLNEQVLSDYLPEIHEKVDDGIQKVTDLIEKFQEKRSKFEQDHQGELVETP
jgi:polyribonucleotide nucleotidyltransferase